MLYFRFGYPLLEVRPDAGLFAQAAVQYAKKTTRQLSL